jgi:hypothetical protein
MAAQGRYVEAVDTLRAASQLPPRAQLVLACLSSELGQLPQAREELTRYEHVSTVSAESMIPRMVRHPLTRAMMSAAVARIRASH